MASSIRDALLQSSKGKTLVVQMQEHKDIIRRRVRTLKELVHYTFVQFPRENNRIVRFDVYEKSKPKIHQLAEDGGACYEEAINALRFARTSKQANEYAVECLLNA